MLFDFGIGFWILFFVIFLGCGKMCGWGFRKYRKHHRELEGCCGKEEEDRLSNLESRVKGLDRGGREQLPRPAMFRRGDETAEPEPARLKGRRPSALERLQKDFIEGKLTLDEYERELDRLERIE
jgi:hypothetical protein